MVRTKGAKNGFGNTESTKTANAPLFDLKLSITSRHILDLLDNGSFRGVFESIDRVFILPATSVVKNCLRYHVEV
jgi:hypothetical protein